MVFFFFSSRRRHTRCSRDWSSDVCSSDHPAQREVPPRGREGGRVEQPVRATHEARGGEHRGPHVPAVERVHRVLVFTGFHQRSEEHTSELQSRLHLVCRLLLEKKKQKEQPYSR